MPEIIEYKVLPLSNDPNSLETELNLQVPRQWLLITLLPTPMGANFPYLGIFYKKRTVD